MVDITAKFLLDLIRRDAGAQKLAENVKDVGTGVARTPGNLAGSLVDLVRMAVPKSSEVGSSKWVNEKLGVPETKTGAGTAAEIATSFISPETLAAKIGSLGGLAGAAGIVKNIPLDEAKPFSPALQKYTDEIKFQQLLAAFRQHSTGNEHSVVQGIPWASKLDRELVEKIRRITIPKDVLTRQTASGDAHSVATNPEFYLTNPKAITLDTHTHPRNNLAIPSAGDVQYIEHFYGKRVPGLSWEDRPFVAIPKNKEFAVVDSDLNYSWFRLRGGNAIPTTGGGIDRYGRPVPGDVDFLTLLQMAKEDAADVQFWIPKFNGKGK